jgi:hypothetical protein
MGLFWRRTTPAGAWAATIGGFGGWWIATTTPFIEAISRLPFARALNIVAYEIGPTEVSGAGAISAGTASFGPAGWAAGAHWAEAAGRLEADMAVHEPWLILFYTIIAVIACVVVSLFSRQIPEEQLQRFYDLTRTPIEEGEVVLWPCTMPVGVEPPRRKMLLTAGGLEVPMPSATSWAGFIAGWVAVALLVVGFLGIIRL